MTEARPDQEEIRGLLEVNGGTEVFNGEILKVNGETYIGYGESGPEPQENRAQLKFIGETEVFNGEILRFIGENDIGYGESRPEPQKNRAQLKFIGETELFNSEKNTCISKTAQANNKTIPLRKNFPHKKRCPHGTPSFLKQLISYSKRSDG